MIPFVSRSRFREAIDLAAAMQRELREALEAAATHRAEAADLRVALERERTRFDKLLDTTLAMKTQGATTAPEPLAQRPPDPVTQAIIAKAGGNLLLRQHYASVVAEMRAQQTSEAEIAAAILKGVDAAEEGVPG